MDIGEKITIMLTEKHMTRTDLAKAVGIPKSSMSDILNGKVQKLDVQKAREICLALDCTLDYLLLDEVTDRYDSRNRMIAELRNIAEQLPERELSYLLHTAKMYKEAIKE